jgi:hypothetical protein
LQHKKYKMGNTKKKVKIFTDEMHKNIFLFQPTLSSRFTSSGAAVSKSVKITTKNSKTNKVR